MTEQIIKDDKIIADIFTKYTVEKDLEENLVKFLKSKNESITEEIIQFNLSSMYLNYGSTLKNKKLLFKGQNIAKKLMNSSNSFIKAESGFNLASSFDQLSKIDGLIWDNKNILKKISK